MKTTAFLVLSVLLASSASAETGHFTVSANSINGSAFTNYSNNYVTIDFIANGQWNHHPAKWRNYGPEGNGNKAGFDYRAPGLPQGALIVRRGNGAYEYLGRRRAITLAPREIIYLVMNDSIYRDNAGWLNADWFSR